MYKALSYKEWLKVRWVVLGALVVEVAVLIALFIHLRAIIEFNKANVIWSYIVFRDYMFFDQIKYIPLLIGLATGIAQFYPEVQSSRLKLTLHLPLKENNTLLFMMATGFIYLLVMFLVFMGILYFGSSVVFASQITYAEFITAVPWFLSGFAAYFLSAVIMVEPLWSRRIVLAVAGVSFIEQLMSGESYGEFKYVLLPFALMTLVLSFLIILSGFRFKRGAR